MPGWSVNGLNVRGWNELRWDSWKRQREHDDREGLDFV